MPLWINPSQTAKVYERQQVVSKVHALTQFENLWTTRQPTMTRRLTATLLRRDDTRPVDNRPFGIALPTTRRQLFDIGRSIQRSSRSASPQSAAGLLVLQSQFLVLVNLSGNSAATV